MANEAPLRGKDLQDALDAARSNNSPILLSAGRRLRYFSDGMVIGSKQFLRQVASEHQQFKDRLDKDNFVHAVLPDGSSVSILQRLRRLRT